MCIIRKRRQKYGFTFIELTFVVSLMAIVSLAVYSVFSQGINIWQRLTQDVKTEEINIFCEKISFELRNSFKFSGIDFIGREDSISFPALVTSQTEAGQEQEVDIGRIDYSFNFQDKTLERKQANHSQLYQEKSTALRPVLSDVRSLNFQYYYYDPDEEIYLWKTIWQGDEEIADLPLAVRINIDFYEEARDKGITRTITIPAGG